MLKTSIMTASFLAFRGLTRRRESGCLRLASVQPLASEDPAIAEILTFIEGGKLRPLCLPAGTN